jgi:hypothetical protein
MTLRRCMSAPRSGGGILAAQTSTFLAAETGIKSIAAVHSQCRCWVNRAWAAQAAGPAMSAMPR